MRKTISYTLFSLFLAIVFASALHPEIVERYYNKVVTYGIEGSLEKITVKIKDRIMQFTSTYEKDSSYWVYEKKEERDKKKKSYIESGTGFISNHQQDISHNKPTSSFVDPWNSKNYNLPKYKPYKNPIKIWSYSGNSPYATQMIPVLQGKGILINDDSSKLTKLDIDSGNVLWTKTFPESSVAKRGLIIEKDIVYFSAGSAIRAVYFSDGENVRTFGDQGRVLLGDNSVIEPKVWRNNIVTVTRNSEIIVVDKDNGQIVQRGSLKVSSEKKRAGGLDNLYRGPRVWGGVALDSSRDMLFITTSNPAPVLLGIDRPGRNQLSSGIVAFDLLKNKTVWEFQDVAHDLWDLDMAAPPVLTTISKNNATMDIVVVIGKTGNVYALDRDTGKSLHDVMFVRAPVSRVRGEKTSPYQKRSLKPENLLGEFNTQVLENSKWKSGLYDPPRVGEPIRIKGLHGGVIWPGFAISNEKILVAISNDISLISLRQSDNQKSRQDMPECSSCHNGKVQPALYTLQGTRTMEDFRRIIQNGYQAMPGQSIEPDRLSEILRYLTRKEGVTVTTEIALPNLIRSPYKKIKSESTHVAEVILIDIKKGEVIWRVPLTNKEYGLALAGIAFINDSFSVVTGGKDEKLKVIDLETSMTVSEVKLSAIGSVTPLVFSYQGYVYAFIAETGSSTVTLYDSSKQISNKYSLYRLGKLSARLKN